jgi:hypothetical protein
MVLDFEDVDDSGECVVLFLELVVLRDEFRSARRLVVQRRGKPLRGD